MRDYDSRCFLNSAASSEVLRYAQDDSAGGRAVPLGHQERVILNAVKNLGYSAALWVYMLHY